MTRWTHIEDLAPGDVVNLHNDAMHRYEIARIIEVKPASSPNYLLVRALDVERGVERVHHLHKGRKATYLAKSDTEETETGWYRAADQELARRVGGAMVLKDWADERWEQVRTAGLSPEDAVDQLLGEADDEADDDYLAR